MQAICSPDAGPHKVASKGGEPMTKRERTCFLNTSGNFPNYSGDIKFN